MQLHVNNDMERAVRLPLVSVVTPVYNGERYLAECIESVLNQHYSNWEYTIVNNCSNDDTLAIANRYANVDARVRVCNNENFVDLIRNHNIAVRSISAGSKYCKVVSADDWIMPDCLERMVALAEAHPRVGIVGSYQSSGAEVKWKGLSPDVRVISGREVCRSSLLDRLYIFGTPTSSLYRSDLIRRSDAFFPHSQPHADTSACYEYLQGCDYGFVHEVLSIDRIHDGQVTSKLKAVGGTDLAFLDDLLKYGPTYLTEQEFSTRKTEVLDSYYRFLGGCILKMRERGFWSYQIRHFQELGFRMPWRKVVRGAIREIWQEMHHPRIAFGKLATVVRQKCDDVARHGLWA
jgi:glycosyltransferase involved in cell wall biosynthesis